MSKNRLWIVFACLCAIGFLTDRLWYVLLTGYGVRLPLLLLLLAVELVVGIAALRASKPRIWTAVAALVVGLAIGNWWLVEFLLVGLIWRTRGFAP
jgi:hypothetical protein